MKRIAIVGSSGKHWTPAQRTKVIKKISDIFWNHSAKEYRKKHGTGMFMEDYPMYVTLVSGGCGYLGEDKQSYLDGGVDIWAEIVADIFLIPKDIKYAETSSWEDRLVYEDIKTERNDEKSCQSWEATGRMKKGYKTRNIEVAKDCDVLYCFDPAWREWSGGRWTYVQAGRLGKEVHLELIE